MLIEREGRSYFKQTLGLAREHSEVWKLHRESGHLERYKQNTDDPGGIKGRWGDVFEHCVVEAIASRELAKLLGFSEEETKVFEVAALAHDWDKRPQIEKIGGSKDLRAVRQVYLESGTGLSSKLVQMEVGLDFVEQVVSLTGATDPVNTENLMKIATLDDEGNMSLRENASVLFMAMYYLDIVTTRDQITDVDTRMNYLDANIKGKYPYAMDPHFLDAWHGRNLYEAMREIGHLVEERLGAIAELPEDKLLSRVILDRVVE